MEYAILDIETTGGKFNEEGITEIAIYRFDGHTVVDQFASLVNPERKIQPFVINLTGINNDMLRNAPKFYEVAKRIVEITQDAVLVAHNAKFDNRILTTEFDRLGFKFERETICTVELAKELIPDLPSYSLGKLVRSLGIPLSDRHRAQGDAKATVDLFKLLLSKDVKKEIVQQFIKKEVKKQVEPKLLDMIKNTPSITGVYYMHDATGKIIYIGKSKNIKKRLTQHFTNDNRKSKKLQLDVHTITYEATGNELIALLKESAEIKANQPIFNKALRKNTFNYQLVSFIDVDGYINLKIEKADKRKQAITTFTNYQQAQHIVNSIVEKFNLCQRLTGLQTANKSCFNYGIKECEGACIGKEMAAQYNSRVEEFIEEYSYANKHMLIIDRGREADEKAVVLIEDGMYKGYGYFNLNHQITKPEILKQIITPAENNRDTQHIIQIYLRKNKRLKIIKLNETV